jgi:hypothetical protein
VIRPCERAACAVHRLPYVVMDVLSSFLVKLAPSSAAGWLALGAEVFRGTSELETTNSVYAIEGGVLVSRTKRGSSTVERPKGLVGLRLVGFLTDEDGLYGLSPRWKEGSLAVLFRVPKGERTPDERSFVVTTATLAFRVPPPASGLRLVRSVSPPTVRRPLPASLTRLFAATTTL